MSSPTGAYSRSRRPMRAHGRLDGVAHAVQHLDLEAVVGHAEAARGGDGGGERAHVVAGEGGAHDVDALEHEAREALVGDVGVGLVREDRRRPALLAGEHRLVVPVGALDEAHGERRGSRLRPQAIRASRSSRASRR